MPWPNGRSFLAALVLTIPVAASAAAVRDNLYGVRAIGPTEAWAVGTFGAIYHTLDAGRSWTAVESGTKQPLFAIDFAPDGTRGWAVGKSAMILTTADGGKTWKPQHAPIAADKHLFKVEAVDARTAWAIGDWGAIVSTRDGGATWQDRSLGTFTIKQETSPDRTTNVITDDVILYDISFPDPQHGYICGEFGTLLATDDGGATWDLRRTPTEKTLFGVHFTTRATGWAVGIDGLVLRTDDGGHAWTVQHGEPETAPVDEISFVESMKNPAIYAVRVEGRHGVAVGDVGLLLVSTDGGRSWKRRELPGSDKLVWLRDVSLVTGDRGIMVGGNGYTGALSGDRILPSGADPR